MGNCSMGPPADFIVFLRDSFGLDTFIEGGTYRGTTARWAGTIFGRVVTIELSEELHKAAKTRLSPMKNVDCLQGNTREVLNAILPTLTGPAVFWLDAHWSGGITAGEENECPILEEIAAINESSFEHVILIDDARLFLAPPPAPHKREQWPDVWEVEQALRSGRIARRTLIADDVIIAVPQGSAERVLEFWHRRRPATPTMKDRAITLWKALRS